MENTEKTIQKIKEALPHGNGINYNWEIEIQKNKAICKNSYDYMNEYGMYDGVFPFTVKFTTKNMSFQFRNLTNAGYRDARNYDLRSYLDELLYESFDEIKTILEEYNNKQKNIKKAARL